MGKRSNFKRLPRDYYRTWDPRAVEPLVPHLPKMGTFVEPCAGDGSLIKNIHELTKYGMCCTFASDIEPQESVIPEFVIAKLDALELKSKGPKLIKNIITNPPWDVKILHPMIEHFRKIAPTWLLFYADWMHTKRAIPYLTFCEKIVSIGRVKCIEHSKYGSKENAAWYLFGNEEKKTIFYGR